MKIGTLFKWAYQDSAIGGDSAARAWRTHGQKLARLVLSAEDIFGALRSGDLTPDEAVEAWSAEWLAAYGGVTMEAVRGPNYDPEARAQATIRSGL